MREYVWLECTVCGARNYRTNNGEIDLIAAVDGCTDASPP